MDIGFLLKNSINLAFKNKLEFEFDRIPLCADVSTFRKKKNLIKIAFNRLFPIAKPMGFPYMAHVDPAGVCNLRCFNCPVLLPDKKGKCLLSFDIYKKFVDEIADYLLYIILWSWGEPLLNPNICEMIRYASERNILTVTSTNLNKLTREKACELMYSGLTALIVALDGAEKCTYEKLRKGGSFDLIMENLDILMDEKKKCSSATPLINLRMVVSRENEHEIEKFRQIGRTLGVDMISLKAYSTRQSGSLNPAVDRKFSPETEELRWYKYHPDFTTVKKIKKYKCKFPWTKPMLFADGTIASCEFDFGYDHTFGNLKDQSFCDIWFSEKANQFRKQFLKNRNYYEFCRDCVFDYTLIKGCVLSREFPNKK